MCAFGEVGVTEGLCTKAQPWAMALDAGLWSGEGNNSEGCRCEKFETVTEEVSSQDLRFETTLPCQNHMHSMSPYKHFIPIPLITLIPPE